MCLYFFDCIQKLNFYEKLCLVGNGGGKISWGWGLFVTQKFFWWSDENFVKVIDGMGDMQTTRWFIQNLSVP